VISEKPASHSPEAACKLWSDYCRLSRVNTSEDRGHGGHHPYASSVDAAAADAAAATCALEPRRGATWCVSENWAHKPCVKRVSQLLKEGAVGCDMRYNVVLSQNIPKEENLGWRAKAGETYQGGWALDVGVHAVRALRIWFGHVEQVDRLYPEPNQAPNFEPCILDWSTSCLVRSSLNPKKNEKRCCGPSSKAS
jgi:hypothetical protein